jgi:hypothetical protein
MLIRACLDPRQLSPSAPLHSLRNSLVSKNARPAQTRKYYPLDVKNTTHAIANQIRGAATAYPYCLINRNLHIRCGDRTVTV